MTVHAPRPERSPADPWRTAGRGGPQGTLVLTAYAACFGGLLKLGRVKRCGRCPWLFVDRSKNASRRWCDMNDCGRAEKIERYVARRAERRKADRQA